MNKKDLLKLIEQLPDDTDIEVGHVVEDYAWDGESADETRVEYMSFTSDFGIYKYSDNVYRLCQYEDQAI